MGDLVHTCCMFLKIKGLLLSKGNAVCLCVCIFINDVSVSIDYCLTFESVVDYSCTFKGVDYITTMQILKKH